MLLIFYFNAFIRLLITISLDVLFTKLTKSKTSYIKTTTQTILKILKVFNTYMHLR